MRNRSKHDKEPLTLKNQLRIGGSIERWLKHNSIFLDFNFHNAMQKMPGPMPSAYKWLFFSLIRLQLFYGSIAGESILDF